MVWVGLEDGGVFCPGITDGLKGRSPSQGFEVLGEVVGCDEGQHVSLEAFDVLVVERLDGAVHPLGLAVGPGMTGLGKAVLDAVCQADAIKDMGAQMAPCWALAVLGQVGEGHAVVGEDFVDLVWEGRDDVLQEGRALHFASLLLELDIGELGNSVDGQEHDELAVGAARRCRCARGRSRRS